MTINVGRMPISDNETYTVAVSNSLANGALGYWKVWSKDKITSRSKDTTNVSALDTYMQANPKIDYSKRSRIVVAK